MRTFQTPESEPTSRTGPFTTEDAPRRRPPACEIAPELLAEELQALAASCRRQLERCVQSPDAGRLRRATALLATTADAAQLAAGLVQRPGEEVAALVRPTLELCVQACRATAQVLGAQHDEGLRDVAAACRTLADLVGGWQPPVTPVPSASRARARRRVEPAWSTGTAYDAALVGARG